MRRYVSMDDGWAGEGLYGDFVRAGIIYGSVARSARAMRSGQLVVTALLINRKEAAQNYPFEISRQAAVPFD